MVFWLDSIGSLVIYFPFFLYTQYYLVSQLTEYFPSYYISLSINIPTERVSRGGLSLLVLQECLPTCHYLIRLEGSRDMVCGLYHHLLSDWKGREVWCAALRRSLVSSITSSENEGGHK